MKKITLYALMVIIVSSCSKDFLQEVPKDFISSGNYYQNATQIENALDAVYGAMWGEGDKNTYKNYLALHTDYAIAAGSFTSLGNWDKPFASNARARSDGNFSGFYTLINRANIVLGKTPTVSSIDESTRLRILGEAHFLRAWAYFELLRFWGPVPLRTEEFTGDSKIGIPRAPKDSIYDLIITDLLTAEKNCSDDVGANTGRASKWAAKMLLAQVYLDKEDWSNAAAKADEVIKTGHFSLIAVNKPDDFYQIFATKTTSPEEIMAYHFSQDVKPYFMQWWLGVGTPYNRGVTFGFTNLPDTGSPFIKNWNSDDLRKSFNLFSSYVDDNGDTVHLTGVGSTRYKKYIKDPNGDALYNLPIYRLAGAYLIYAEASCMENGSPTPLGLERLNIIKRRGYGYDPYTPSPVDYPTGMSKDQFRDSVIQERGYEFFVEGGSRWWDLKRTGKAIEVISAASGQQVIEARLLWPIPVQEIDTNPEIGPDDQNPGY